MGAVEIDSDEQIQRAHLLKYTPSILLYMNTQKNTQININHTSTLYHTAERRELNREHENVRYSLCSLPLL